MAENRDQSWRTLTKISSTAPFNIIPLFKKGSRNKSVNYRPVSLTSVTCKVLETIIRDHMMDFLIKHKLINPSQHGFLNARSCLTNLLCFFEEITKWVDGGSPVDVIYLDFQKAFDKVPHQRLILKLKSHGMGNSIINWIEQWLNDMIQRVVVAGEVSSSSFVSFTQLFPTCGRMPLPALSLWPGRQPCRPRLVDGMRGGGPSSVAPRSRNPPTGRRRDSPISSSLFLHGPPLCAVG